MAAAKGDTSPEEQTVTNRVAALEPSTGSLTVNVEMKKATEYSKESKSVSAYLKIALPDDALIGEEGSFSLHNEFRETVERVSREMLALCEVACATQHGLAVQSDEAGVVRVLGLFPGGTSTPAAVAPSGATGGPFSAPAATPAAAAPVPAAAPAAAPVPVGAGAPVPGGAAPAAASAAGNANPFKTDNPKAWSNQSQERKNAIMDALEAWVQGAPTDEVIENKMVVGERYPKVVVSGTNVSVKMLLKGNDTPARVKVWAEDCIAAGVVVPD